MIVVIAEGDREITDIVNALIVAAEHEENMLQARRWRKLADTIETQREVVRRDASIH